MLLAGTVSAQGPQWRAGIPAPAVAGRHAVRPTPELLGASRADLGDVRLLDSTGQEVPFVWHRAQRALSEPDFERYHILRNGTEGRHTVLEIECTTGRFASRIDLLMRPADVHKKLRVLGSDDRVKWFMLKDEHVAPQLVQDEPPRQVLVVRTPEHDYRYLRFILNDSLTAPLNIIEAGHRKEGERPEERRSGVPLAWQQVDSARFTFLKVASPGDLLLDRLLFTVRDSNDFQRNGHVEVLETVSYRRKRRERTRREVQVVCGFMIASDQARAIDLPGPLRLDTFQVVIDNGDDRPLRFAGLEGSIPEHLLIADLLPGMAYTLTTGDPLRTPPHYDLVHFEAEGPPPLDTLDTGPLIGMTGPSAVDTLVDPSKWWVWMTIIILMAGMAWMAVRMLREPREDHIA